MWLSVAFASYGHSIVQASKFSATALVPFIIWTHVRTPAHFRQLLWAIGLGTALSAAIGLLQFAGKVPVVTQQDVEETEDTRGRVIETEEDGNITGRRFAGVCRNPNSYAMLLMGGIPTLFYLAMTRRWPVVAAPALLACIAALWLTMSRTVIFSFMLFLPLVIYWLWKAGLLTGRRCIVGGLVAVAAYSTFSIAGGSLPNRLLAIAGSRRDASTEARFQVLGGGLRAFIENPITGVGLDDMSKSGYNPSGNAAHDALSSILGELGGLGTVAVLGLIWQTFVLLRAVEWKARENPKLLELIIFLKAGLVAKFFEGFGHSVYDDRYFLIYLGLFAALYQIVVATTSAENSSQPTAVAAPPTVSPSGRRRGRWQGGYSRGGPAKKHVAC